MSKFGSMSFAKKLWIGFLPTLLRAPKVLNGELIESFAEIIGNRFEAVFSDMWYKKEDICIFQNHSSR